MIAKVFLLFGVVFIVIGLVASLSPGSGLGRLPGDTYFVIGEMKVFFPLTTSILVSIVLTIGLWIFHRL